MADIGDVDHMDDAVALPLKNPPQRVREDVSAKVADVLVGVDRRSTGVDASGSTLKRREFLEFSPERVEQPKRHTRHEDALHHTRTRPPGAVSGASAACARA